MLQTTRLPRVVRNAFQLCRSFSLQRWKVVSLRLRAVDATRSMLHDSPDCEAALTDWRRFERYQSLRISSPIKNCEVISFKSSQQSYGHQKWHHELSLTRASWDARPYKFQNLVTQLLLKTVHPSNIINNYLCLSSPKAT